MRTPPALAGRETAMTTSAPSIPLCDARPCPSCGAPRVYRSRRKGITEHLFSIVGARIRRCHACNVRFALLFNSAIFIDDGRRALRRATLLLALMLAGAALIGLAMLWFMGKQAEVGPSDCLLAPASQAQPRA